MAFIRIWLQKGNPPALFSSFILENHKQLSFCRTCRWKICEKGSKWHMSSCWCTSWRTTRLRRWFNSIVDSSHVRNYHTNGWLFHLRATNLFDITRNSSENHLFSYKFLCEIIRFVAWNKTFSVARWLKFMHGLSWIKCTFYLHIMCFAECLFFSGEKRNDKPQKFRQRKMAKLTNRCNKNETFLSPVA